MKAMKPLSKSIFLLIMGVFGFVLLTSCEDNRKKTISPIDMEVHGEMDAVLTAAPNVPPPVGNREASKVYIDMEVTEEVMELADGTEYLYWTFNGTVPGSFIRLRVGDEVEFTLKNHPDNKLPHNIDLHAVTGPGGGADASFVAPGQQVTFGFKAINPGLYIYHCATPPVPLHIANGMYGLILVEPAGGLPPVDKEYYIVQSEFYTEGETGAQGLQPFDLEKALAEDADYVVFNGKMEALSGENAIEAEVGETIRLYVGNAGPSLVSSFHIIGEIMDRVYADGGTTIKENVSTTTIPAGGAAIVEFKAEVPGELVLVDHSIFRAFNKGALGILKIEGEATKESREVFKGIIDERAHPLSTAQNKVDRKTEQEVSGLETPETSEDADDGALTKIELLSNDQMRFDKNQLKVKAGQRVQLTLKHTGNLPASVMGHNFVLLKKGTDVADFAREAVSAAENHYVPEGSNDVIAYTPIIGGGEEVTIEFDAPAPGTYTFICSFPGHYVMMKGTFVVE